MLAYATMLFDKTINFSKRKDINTVINEFQVNIMGN